LDAGIEALAAKNPRVGDAASSIGRNTERVMVNLAAELGLKDHHLAVLAKAGEIIRPRTSQILSAFDDRIMNAEAGDASTLREGLGAELREAFQSIVLAHFSGVMPDEVDDINKKVGRTLCAMGIDLPVYLRAHMTAFNEAMELAGDAAAKGLSPREVAFLAQAISILSSVDRSGVGNGYFGRKGELATKEHNETLMQLESDVGELLHRVSEAGAVLSKTSGELIDASAMSLSRSREANQRARTSKEESDRIVELTSSLAKAATSLSRQARYSIDVVGEATKLSADASESITLMAEQVSEIGAVVSLIDKIAIQSHMLALNATIEAARAGEAGKGFAVVAGEVKSLAVQTKESARKITDQIDNIKERTEQAVQTYGVVERKISEIDGTISSMTENVAEQEETASLMSRAVGTVAETASGISEDLDCLNDMAAKADKAADEVSRCISALVETTSGAKDQMHRQIEELKK
jgi:methyl-accepting chemotaxis protein